METKIKDLLDAIQNDVVTFKIAKVILSDVFNTDKSVDQIIDDKGLRRLDGNDTQRIRTLLYQLLNKNIESIDYNNRTTFVKDLTMLFMKHTNGRYNPEIVQSLVLKIWDMDYS
jgi:Asp-tRNA(Asn)/Glu-tRNA(Gln) amidotransferase B subunit